jgi:AcrR family transcriptional regulator
MDRIPRSRADKFEERRAELAEAALQTLADLGYARTSLRLIAQNSDFSHGVLHYYFRDKTDLILCSVRQYKARCVRRYDRVTAEATSTGELIEGFLHVLGETACTEAALHRLWYDLRAQALFQPEFRTDVAAIDRQLEDMVWRVVRRGAELGGVEPSMPSPVVYAAVDGLFQQALLRHLSGDAGAVPDMQRAVRSVVEVVVPAAHVTEG